MNIFKFPSILGCLGQQCVNLSQVSDFNKTLLHLGDSYHLTKYCNGNSLSFCPQIEWQKLIINTYIHTNSIIIALLNTTEVFLSSSKLYFGIIPIGQKSEVWCRYFMNFFLKQKKAHILLGEKSNLAWICCIKHTELHLKTGQVLPFKYYSGYVLLGTCLLCVESFFFIVISWWMTSNVDDL